VEAKQKKRLGERGRGDFSAWGVVVGGGKPEKEKVPQRKEGNAEERMAQAP